MTYVLLEQLTRKGGKVSLFFSWHNWTYVSELSLCESTNHALPLFYLLRRGYWINLWIWSSLTDVCAFITLYVYMAFQDEKRPYVMK